MRARRTMVLGHVSCQMVVVILEGTTGLLRKSWSLRSTGSVLLGRSPDDGYTPLNLDVLDEVYPVIVWERALILDTGEERDNDGEYEDEGHVEVDYETNCGVAWDNLIYTGAF